MVVEVSLDETWFAQKIDEPIHGSCPFTEGVSASGKWVDQWLSAANA
jgi:hypothetical protein